MKPLLPASARPRRVLRLATALLIPLALTACGSDDGGADPASTGSSDEGETPDSMAGADAGSAELTMAGQSFSFDLAVCAIDPVSVVAHGPGQDDASGEPAYLEVDVTADDSVSTGGVDVRLGATTAMSSTDQVLKVSIDSGHDHDVEIEGTVMRFDGEFHAGDGTKLGPGSLRLACP